MTWLSFCAFGIFVGKSRTLNIDENNTWWQFYQHVLDSFYTSESQKEEKDTDNLTEFLRLWDLRV